MLLVGVGVGFDVGVDVIIEAEGVTEMEGVSDTEGVRTMFTVAELTPLVLLLAWKNTVPSTLVDWNWTDANARLNSVTVPVNTIEFELDAVTELPFKGKVRAPFDTETVNC